MIHMPNHTLLSSALHTTSQGFQALLVWPWGLPFSPRVYIPLFTSTGQSDSPRNIPASILRSSKATGRINLNWTNATRAENPCFFGMLKLRGCLYFLFAANKPVCPTFEHIGRGRTSDAWRAKVESTDTPVIVKMVGGRHAASVVRESLFTRQCCRF